MGCIAGTRCAASFPYISLALNIKGETRREKTPLSARQSKFASRRRDRPSAVPRTFLDMYRGRKTKCGSTLFRRKSNLKEY